ncbi:sulfotransferase 1B1-like isoform X2 [Argopecten irradians]|uniref:sulfotransferase 1B1-like isoform X2 n=1 Tax=Argopecten irradians TaxID=31199 RepID=UPI003717A08B
MELAEFVDDIPSNKCSYKRFQGRPFHRIVPGSHWMYNTIQMLRTGTLTYSGTPFVADFEDLGWVETMETPRTFLTHLTFPLIPSDAKSGVPKIIFLSRNPKDVLVSYFHFIDSMINTGFEGDFSFFMKFFLSEEFFSSGASWFTYMKEWADGIKEYPEMRILSLTYEDFKKDTFGCIKTLDDFLVVNRSVAFLQDVEKHIAFENLKNDHSKITDQSARWTVVDKYGKVPIYRKGRVGDWKRKFTVAQNECFNATYRQKMAGYHLDFDYE